MAKAESAKSIGNMEEAEAFTLKVNELLIKHNLSTFDVDKPNEGNTVINKEFPNITPRKNEGRWIFSLYNTLCKFNFAKAITINGWDPKKGGIYTYLMVFGEPENLEAVMFLGDQLESKIRYIGRDTYKKVGKQLNQKKNTFLRAFYEYAVIGLYHKLEELRAKQEQEISNVTSLVLCKDAKIDEAVEDKLGELGKPKRKKPKGGAGAALGYEAGRNLEINKGLTTEKNISLN